jgi:hypothetical protein
MSRRKTASGSAISDLRDVVRTCTSHHISASSWNFWNLQESETELYFFKHTACLSTVKSSNWLKLSIATEWLAFLFHILEVSDPNLSLETSYPDSSFLWFSSGPPGKLVGENFKLGHNCFLAYHFKFIIH